MWSYIFNFSPFITSNIFIIPIARLTQWAADVIWTSNGRLYDVRPSVHRKYGTSGGRPNSVHYGRPLDTPICDQFNQDMFASSYLGQYLHSFTSKFYVQKILNISFWVWKCGFWKGTKGCREKRGKGPIKYSTAF